MKYIIPLLCGLAMGQTSRQHIETSITIHLNAPPKVVLPLFGPVREAEWAVGWNPAMIHSEIPGAVFTTGESAWVMTVYDEARLRVGYVFLEPGISANQIDIFLIPAAGGATEATVTYRRTALSEAGDTQVAKFAAHFPMQKQHWEQAINARLKEFGKMTDAEFARAFESCELSNADFHHRDHIRLAWIYLNESGAGAGSRMAASIRNFAAHHGKSDKYHETVTQAWIRLVADCAKCRARDFEALIAKHPELLDKTILGEFYSDAVLQSERAREQFVPPDRRALPD